MCHKYFNSNRATKEFLDCKIIATPGKYDFKPFAIGYQKDPPCAEMFDHHIKQMRVTGVLDQIKTEYNLYNEEPATNLSIDGNDNKEVKNSATSIWLGYLQPGLPRAGIGLPAAAAAALPAATPPAAVAAARQAQLRH